MENDPDSLAGLRILIVEDEAMIAVLLEDMLQDFGCRVAGIAPSVEKAMPLVRELALDGALLDMNMHGRSTLAVAKELAARSVPFLLVTGYGAGDNDPPVMRNAPRLTKPFTQAALARRMAEVFAATAVEASAGSAK